MPSSRRLLLASLAVVGAGAGTTAALELAPDGGTAGDAAPAASTTTATGRLPLATAAAPAPADGGDARAVYAAAKESVVAIRAQTIRGTATGTGFVVSADGRIVTNDHVVQGAREVTVRIGSDGAARTATVETADPSHDLAVLRVRASGLKPLQLAGAATVTVGEAVYAIGSPYGLDETLTSGIVSATDRTIDGLDGSTIDGAIQTDAALNPGNSGGPLLDADGRVIGVNAQIASGGSGGNVGVGFAIGADTVRELLA